MKKFLLATSMFVLLAGCQNMKPAETDNTKTFILILHLLIVWALPQ